MKRMVYIICLSLIFLGIGLSGAEAWNPNGTWINLDLAGGGTQRIEINFPQIHGYGQCTPSPCNWGNALYTSKLVATHDKTDSDRDAYMAVWVFSFKWTFMRILPHPENPNYIIVESWDLYDIAGDTRANRYTIEYLKKQ